MKTQYLKKVSALLLINFFIHNISWAAPTSIRGLLNDQSEQSTSVSEYVFRNDVGETLVPIYLMGAVSKPGLYHIPLNTDLVSLITLAGGPNSDAKLDEVMVRRKTAEKADVVNVEKMVEMRNLGIQPLKEGDVVYLKAKKPFFSSDVTAAVGILAATVGIVMTSFLIKSSIER